VPRGSKPLRRKARTKPSPSNMSPTSRPSPSRRTALQAPATLAIVDTRSSSDRTLTLCGMVISAPRAFSSAKKARSTSAKTSRRQPMGTTAALMPADAKYGL
jgi:hypothetical protein